MNILVCYMWYLRPGGAGIKRFNEFCRLWQRVEDVQVTVLTSMVDHNSGEIFPDLKGRGYAWEEDNGVRLLRVNLPDTYSRGFAGRAWSQIGWAYNARRALKLIERPDIVLASSPHLWVTLPGVAAKRKWRIPFLLEIRDLWPEMIVNLEVATWNHPGVKWLARHEQWAYRQADYMVTLVPTQINNIVERGLFDRSRMATITNGVMLEDFDVTPSERRMHIRRELGIDDEETLVMYLGAHGRLNDLIKLVEIAEELKDRVDIRFVSIGDGPERGMLIEETQRRGLTNLRFLGPIPSAEVPAYLSACDIGCSLLNTRKLTRYDNRTRGVFRNAFFDYAGARRPLVFNIPGFPEDEIEHRARGGLFASTVDGGREAADKIRYLADNPEQAREMGERNYQGIAVEYNRPKMAAQYLEIMRGLVAANRSR